MTSYGSAKLNNNFSVKNPIVNSGHLSNSGRKMFCVRIPSGRTQVHLSIHVIIISCTGCRPVSTNPFGSLEVRDR
jgi:hypothetical protein